MSNTNDIPEHAGAIEKWLAHQNGAFTPAQIKEQMELDINTKEMRDTLKLLIKVRRVRKITPKKDSNELYYQHIICNKNWVVPESEVMVKEHDPCPPTPVCHIATNNGGRCFKCPVFTKQVDDWTEVPDDFQYPEQVEEKVVYAPHVHTTIAQPIEMTQEEIDELGDYDPIMYEDK